MKEAINLHRRNSTILGNCFIQRTGFAKGIKRIIVLGILTVVILAFFSVSAWADYTWTTLDYPGSTRTDALGISGSNIVGYTELHGFLYNGTSWTTLDYPGASGTVVNGIDGSNMVGSCWLNNSSHGFLYNGTTWTLLAYPGADGTHPTGISGNNIVGYAGSHGFLYNGTTWTLLDYPGAYSTSPNGISGNNIVGNYFTCVNSNCYSHGFLYDGTSWTTLDYPGAGDAGTVITGISGNNIIGRYDNDQGFLYNGSTWATLGSYPGANLTLPLGISGNNIVGLYRDVNGFVHGFLATPSAPPLTHTITASAGANGSISPSGAVTVNHNGSQTFNISPTTNYHVADVLVDSSSVGAVTSYGFTNVTANHTISASFVINTIPTHTITASAGANGNIDPSGTVSVNHGNTQSFTVNPDSGYLAVMSGTCGGNLVGTNYTTNPITADCTVNATFNSSGPNPPLPIGDNVQVQVPISLPSGGSTTAIVTFSQIDTEGTLSIVATNTPLGGGLPSGFNFLGRYYDVTFTGSFSGYIYITLPYDGSSVPSGKEQNLKLFHWKNPGWENCTYVLDTGNNTITGRVTSLSPFGFGYESSSSSSSVSARSHGTGANENMIAFSILAILAGVFLLRRYRRFTKV